MRILFLARRFYPDIGGVEKHVMEIGKILIKKGHSVSVITQWQPNKIHPNPPLGKEGVISFEIVNGIRIYRFSGGKQNWFLKFKIWIGLWELRNLINDADIVHCHDVFFWYLPFRFLYPNKKVFTTFHGYENFPIPWKAIWVRKLSEKLSIGNICIGDFIPKWYGTKPDYVSYGGVNTSIKYKESSIKEKRESAVFFGRLDEQTGIQTYSKAFQIVKKYFPKFEFLVIGDGKYKNLIADNIKILGFQKNPEKYFMQYRFAFVSRYLSILEAMAVKRLIFAVYDNPLKEDYLRMSPFAKMIIIAGNEKDLAEKVIYYLKNPSHEKKLTEEAYEWVKKQSWENLTKVYLNLWRK